jgi:hypothetical protein
MTLLFYTLASLVIGLTLFAFVRKPVLLQAMHPAVNGMVTRLTSRRAKHVYWGFFYLFRALANLALLLFGVLLFLLSGGDEKSQADADDDFRYKHEGETYYTHSTGDSSNSWY